MHQSGEEGLRLHHSNWQSPVTDVAEINEVLRPVGARVWPLELRSASTAARQLLLRPVLSEDETNTVLQQFLLSRQRILELITEAGRQPQVADGGEMNTLDSGTGVTYPQLYIVEPGADYTRFDHYHVNTTSEGSGIDEVMQVLCGGGIRLIQHLPDGQPFTLKLDCITDERGWILTYDGGRPHIGSLSQGHAGTKLLVQAIGPAQWHAEYVDT